MTDADVVVVGGGPAGASTAFQLARRGVDTLVLDRSRFPRGKACAECLSPQASRILQDMGVLDALTPAGARMSGIEVRSPDGTTARGDYVASHGFRGFRDWGLSIRREILDHALLESATGAGARVEQGARVTDVVRDGGAASRVRIFDASGRERMVRARLVVGADGLRLLVARRLGLARSAAWPRRIAIVAHYRGVRGVGNLVELHVERTGFVGIADVGRSVTTVAAVFTMRRAPEISAAGAAHFLGGWLAGIPHLASRFRGATPDDAPRVTGPFASHVRRAWAAGALLVGDAADFFDPFTGEGVYAALRGGELAASAAFAALGGERDALASYDAERRREFGGKWLVEKLVGVGVANPWLMNRAVRGLSLDRELADLVAGVTGDFVPAGRLLRLGVLPRLFLAARGAGHAAPAATPATR